MIRTSAASAVSAPAPVCAPPGGAAVDGRGGARGRRRWWPGEARGAAPRVTPYRVAVVVALAVLVPVCLRLPWSGDIGQHASTIWRLRENLARPTSPLIDVPGDGSPYFSPYHLAGALVSRATGWSPLVTLRLFALVNVALVLAGIGAFTRALTPRRWAPVFALLAYFFLWGTETRVWSGYESFLSFCYGVSYPSACAAGVTFLLWAAALRLLGRVPEAPPLVLRPAARAAAHAALGLGLAVVLLSHPFTAVVACLGLAAVLAGSLRSLTARQWTPWALSAAVTLGAVAAWPYFHLLSLRQSPLLDGMHAGLYGGSLGWFGFALLLGLPALANRLRRDRLDPLVLTFALTGLAVLYGKVSGHYSWGRAYPGVITTLQLAAALELAELELPLRLHLRRTASMTAAVALAAGVWVQSGAAFLVVSRTHFPRSLLENLPLWNPWPGYDWAGRYLAYGDVVMTRGERPLVMLPGYGYYTVQAGYPDPAVRPAVLAERGRDTDEFFARGTGEARRAELMRKYRASWVLIRPQDGQVPGGAEFRPVACSRQGEILSRLVAAAPPARS